MLLTCEELSSKLKLGLLINTRSDRPDHLSTVSPEWTYCTEYSVRTVLVHNGRKYCMCVLVTHGTL